MLKLILIPIIMILAAMIMLYVDSHKEQWVRDKEIRYLIRKNRVWERQIEEKPHQRMHGAYAVCVKR